jgi:hypothetical protein
MLEYSLWIFGMCDFAYLATVIRLVWFELNIRIALQST